MRSAKNVLAFCVAFYVSHSMMCCCASLANPAKSETSGRLAFANAHLPSVANLAAQRREERARPAVARQDSSRAPARQTARQECTDSNRRASRPDEDVSSTRKLQSIYRIDSVTQRMDCLDLDFIELLGAKLFDATAIVSKAASKAVRRQPQNTRAR